MPGDTRPTWINDDEGDLPGSDDAIMADIQRAMESRGYTDKPNDGQPEGAISTPASNTATDPGSQPEGAEAGAPASANAPVVDAAPTPDTGGAVTPGQERPAPETPGGPEGELPPPDPATQTFNVTLESGDKFAMTNQQANYLIQLHSWIDSKPQEVKDQWRGIENGTHQAIPKEDAAAYQAWVQAGRPTATQPALERPPFDASFVNQDFLDYVGKLEAQAKASGVPHSTVPQPTPQAPQLTEADVMARATAQANRTVQVQQALDQSTAAIRDKYSLTPEQVAHLNRVTPALGIIPGIAEQHRTYSPLGDLISDAPMGTVFTQAFEVAMTTDPTLRAIYEDHIIQTHTAANADTLAKVGTKKANAASLASAPSAAVPGKDIDPRKMTHQQRHDAMVAELAEMMSQQ